MKKLILIILAGFLYTGIALADNVDDGLPAGTGNAVKASTRAMIKAGVEAEQGMEMTRTMLKNQYQEQQIVKAQECIMEAARQGIPTEPLMNKAHEGMAKKRIPRKSRPGHDASSKPVCQGLQYGIRSEHRPSSSKPSGQSCGRRHDCRFARWFRQPNHATTAAQPSECGRPIRGWPTGPGDRADRPDHGPCRS